MNLTRLARRYCQSSIVSVSILITIFLLDWWLTLVIPCLCQIYWSHNCGIPSISILLGHHFPLNSVIFLTVAHFFVTVKANAWYGLAVQRQDLVDLFLHLLTYMNVSFLCNWIQIYRSFQRRTVFKRRYDELVFHCLIYWLFSVHQDPPGFRVRNTPPHRHLIP